MICPIKFSNTIYSVANPKCPSVNKYKPITFLYKIPTWRNISKTKMKVTHLTGMRMGSKILSDINDESIFNEGNFPNQKQQPSTG